MTRTRGFTLVEMLLAAVLTAVLLGGVMSVAAALARDARRTATRTDSAAVDVAFDLIRWDLTNASTPTDGGLTFTGHGALDRDTLRATGRRARVTYRVRPGAGLVREQRYLDDPVRPEPWAELVLAGAAQIESFITARGSGAMTVRIEFTDGTSVHRTLTR
jgi:prepilin-type N-terminal cleavage/methylation domain-containing protein